MKKQLGFNAMLIATIFLIAIAAVALAYFTRGSSQQTNDKMGKSLALIMIEHGYDFKVALDRFLADGKYSASQMTFDAAPQTGLFDNTAGNQKGTFHKPPIGAIQTGQPLYAYNKQVLLPGVGNSALEDYVVVAPNISFFVCQQINNILHQDQVSAIPAMSRGTLASWIGSSPVDDSASVAVNYVGRSEGCIQSSDGIFMYFKALVEN